MSTQRSLAVYSTADAQYVPQAVVALSSFRRFHPECGYYVLADAARLSGELLALLCEFDIELVDVDLASAYAIDREGPWPTEAFWQLYGPEKFGRDGYRHCLSVDGDVLCVRELPFADVLPRVRAFAGIDNGPASWQLGDAHRLEKEFGITEAQLATASTNAGVVIYNSEFLHSRRFFAESVRLFRAGHPWAFRHQGDQALLALVALALDLPMLELGFEWNFRFDRHPAGTNSRLISRISSDPELGRYSLNIIHFLGGKPWTPYPTLSEIARFVRSFATGGTYVDAWNTRSPARIHWVNEWRRYARELLGEARVRRYFGAESSRAVKSTWVGQSWLSFWDSYLWARMVHCRLRGKPWG